MFPAFYVAMLNTAHLTFCRRKDPPFCMLFYHFPFFFRFTEAFSLALMMAFISVQYGKYSNAFLYTEKTLFEHWTFNGKEFYIELLPWCSR